MNNNNRKNELIPSARRLVTSLRDMGYDFSSAVADIVDNSIAAKARTILIDIHFNGNDSWVRIADDGIGMDAITLRNCMRYGSERDYMEEDLGKFGLGLKTASMSQCRRLTVASRTNSTRQYVVAYRWDLHHIQKTDRWEVLHLDRRSMPGEVTVPLSDTRGTVVLWEQLDRMLGYEYPYGEYARKRLLQMCRELESHLAMVFHRFLSGETGRRKLKIFINGNPVRPWDPYARSEKFTQQLKPVTIQVEQDNIQGEIVIEAFVLPHQDRFSNAQAHINASGPSKWNRQQGFYIYRADRMIQSGGWCRLRTLDEHTKLARLSLSFSPKLDEVFRINVAKMRVQLPAQIRKQVEDVVAPVIKAAQIEYRNSGKSTSTVGVNTKTETDTQTIPTCQVVNPAKASISVTQPSPPGNSLTAESLLGRLMSVANANEKAVLLRLLERTGIQLRSSAGKG